MKQITPIKPTEKDIEQMNRRIFLLRERARKSKTKAEEGFDAQLQAAEDRFDLVKARINQLAIRAESASDELVNGLSKAWVDLKVAVDSAAKKLH